MLATTFNWRIGLVPVFLLTQGLLSHWVAASEHPPAPPDLSRFPAQFGDWKLLNEDPIDADVKAQLHADRLLSRTYVRQPAGQSANLFVAWFQSQRAGASQPHSPKVCLPGSGWIPEDTGEMTLPTAAGTITVNRYIVRKGGDRALVAYWYQSPRRVIAEEWAAKFWLVPDALRDRRSDTALVRIVVPVTGANDGSAVADAFSRNLYPLLRATLP